jgi:hypothetical protein
MREGSNEQASGDGDYDGRCNLTHGENSEATVAACASQ